MSALPAASSFDEHLVRDYARLRRKADAIARRSGLSPEEIEEVFQDAWLVCWRKREEVEHVEAFFGQVMRNIVSERLGWKQRHPTVPLEVVRDQGEGEAGPAIEVPDEDAPSPAEAAERRWEGRVAREIVEELSPLGRRLVKLRWGLDVKPREIRATLGLSEKRYEKEFKAAGTHVFERAARVAEGGWCEERRSLLKWYALGHAGSAQRERAEQHLEGCPACRKMVREVQGTVRGLAVILSGPELLSAAGGGRFPALVDLATSVKQQVADALLEAKVQASAAAARLPGTGSGSGAAAAGGFGATGTVKVATALCVGAGAVGGTAACIEALAPVAALRGDRAEQRERREPPKRHEGVRVASASARLGASRRAAEFAPPRRERRRRSRAAQAELAPSVPAAAGTSSAAISPARAARPWSTTSARSSPPSGDEEFGFEASGPSSSSGGGSGSSSSSEFAPYAGSSSTGSAGSSTGGAGSASNGGEFGGL